MKESPKVVLLLTHSGDFFTIDRVAEAIEKKGATPFRLDTDKFPLEVQLATCEGSHVSSVNLMRFAGAVCTYLLRL